MATYPVSEFKVMEKGVETSYKANIAGQNLKSNSNSMKNLTLLYITSRSTEQSQPKRQRASKVKNNQIIKNTKNI